jgi:hypothetical protein
MISEKLAARTVENQPYLDQEPEIINISYDLWTLRVTLNFSEIEKPVFYIDFINVVGFRLLDERNLLEFWDPQVRVPGWIWKIDKGGWFDLEQTRNGFIENIHENSLIKEYFVTGINECINVMTPSDPIFIDPET